MQIKGLQPKTQTVYLSGMRDFTRFLGRSSDTATPEDLRAFQLEMKERLMISGLSEDWTLKGVHREISEVVRKEGEASSIWFKCILG